MRRDVVAGLAAGAVGTVALNAATYVDMLTRARPASSLPADAAGKLADVAGVDLGSGDDASNRREALGAVLGIATGLAVGAAYGLLRAAFSVPLPAAILGLGAAAMAGSDVPMTRLGLTDPITWDAASWLSDALPHLAYGAAAALSYELFATS